jgi:hypothetical protein
VIPRRERGESLRSCPPIAEDQALAVFRIEHRNINVRELAETVIYTGRP